MGVFAGGRLDGWLYLFQRFEFDGDELLMAAMCTPPRWPFPADLLLDFTLFKRVRPIDGDRRRRLDTTELVLAAHRDAGRPAPEWLTTRNRFSLHAAMWRASRPPKRKT